MNPEKVGQFIKKLRKDNNLTQKALANKYNVTYQAVSKWENGINLPEISLIRQISKDFNISVEDILDGEKSSKKKNKKTYLIITISIILIILCIVLTIILNKKDNSFEFKTISTTCNEFKVSGSIAYDEKKSSIYISNINYCGGNDSNIYQEINCTLYENHADTIKKISDCSTKNNITLEEYLKEIQLKINNYDKECKTYTNESFYLEINATKKDNNTVTYKIPLNLNNNCPK